MAIIKRFTSGAQKNRERVRKHREKKKIRFQHEKEVQFRLKQLFSKSDVCSNSNILTEDVDKQQPTVGFDEMTDFVEKLKFWAINHRITARAISNLLLILIGVGFTSLPKDSRTFMRTPVNLPIQLLSNGKLWYQGLTNCIRKVFAHLRDDISITLNFNFDGLPVFNSSNLQFWPILAAIRGMNTKLFN